MRQYPLMFSEWAKTMLKHPSFLLYALTHSFQSVKHRYIILRSLTADASYTPPFHGDVILQSLIAEIIEFFGVSTFFETGTYLGESLNYVCEHFEKLRIMSCEVDETYYEYASRRLAKCKPKLFNLSSPIALRLARHFSMLELLTLFYLDAHWENYWPLLDELREIRQLKHAIVIVDDFKVPDHPELGYDSYGGNENSLSYIAEVLKPGDESLIIVLPHYREDAYWPEPKRDMRGYAIVFVNLQERFRQFSERDLMRNFMVVKR